MPCIGIFSLLTEADAGHTEFTDEVFQNETRLPGGEWKPAAEPYTDVVRHTRTHTHIVKFKGGGLSFQFSMLSLFLCSYVCGRLYHSTVCA